MNHPLKRMMFSSVELFCLVAEYESFSKAALHAGVSPAAVSRSIREAFSDTIVCKNDSTSPFNYARENLF